MKKKTRVWAAPLLVAAIALTVFAIYSLFPLGKKTLSWCDMSQQVMPLLAEWKDILSGKADLFLNLGHAGGMSFWGVFFFFLSSPFSYLVAFIPKTEMLLFANLLVLFKLMVCALTAAIFFKKVFPTLGTIQVSCLSALYAFCGYAMLFYQNVVWLDMMYLFPLLLLSLRALTAQGKVLPYAICLSAILITNYYLSYMVVLFLILSFGTYLLACVPKRERGKDIVHLALGTGMAALFTAVVWLPSLLQYFASARTDLSLFESLTSGGARTLFTKLPILLCTGCSIAACFFFLKERCSRKDMRRSLLFTLLLLLLPICIEPINVMWHLGSYQAFPMRGGYMLPFFVLILFAFVLQRLAQLPDCPTCGAYAVGYGALMTVVAAFLAVLLLFAKTPLGTYTRTLWLDAKAIQLLLLAFALIALAYFLLVALRRHQKLSHRAFTGFLTILVIVECLFNGGVYIGTAADSTDSYRQSASVIGQIEDDGFYRVKSYQKYFPVNDMGAFGYPSLGHYTSLTSRDYLYGMKKLGYSSYWMEVASNGGTLLTDAILSQKYMLSKGATPSFTYQKIKNSSIYQIYENRYALPLGLITSSDLRTYESLPTGERTKNQQLLYQALFDQNGNLLTFYRPTKATNVTVEQNAQGYHITRDGSGASLLYEIEVKGDQVLYLDCFQKYSNALTEPVNGALDVYVNGRRLMENYPSKSNNGYLDLGRYQDSTVTVELILNMEIWPTSFGVFGMDAALAENALKDAKTPELTIDGHHITGTAYAQSQGETLFLAIPYQRGYKAQVNGKDVEVLRVLDTFLAIPLEAGENQVTLRYTPSGFPLGIALTIVGALLMVTFAIARRKGHLQAFPRTGRWLAPVFWCLWWVTLIAIYLFPVVGSLIYLTL